MAEVTVAIHGRNYVIACDDGQEAHVERLGRELDRRVRTLGSAGTNGDALLLVMVALTALDEVADLRAAVEALERQAAAGDTAGGDAAQSLDAAAERIETVAARLTAA